MDFFEEMEWNFVSLFQKQDIAVLEKDRTFEISGTAENVDVDFVLEIEGKKVLAEAKQSKNLSNFKDTVFFRTYAHLNAALREADDPDLTGLMVLSIDSFGFADFQRLDRHFKKYAPEMGWMVVANEKNILYRLSSSTDVMLKQVGHPSRSVSDLFKDLGGGLKRAGVKIAEKLKEVSASIADAMTDTKSRWEEEKEDLRFSDLELWMFKVLFYNHYPPDGVGEEPDRRITNGNQLIEEADVSPGTVYSWLNAMESAGYLKRTSRKDMKLVRIGEYLDRWTGKYRIDDNPGLRYFEFIDNTDDPYQQFVERLINDDNQKNSVSSDSEPTFNYILTGHGAAKQYDESFSSAKSLQFYRFHDDFEKLRKDLELIPVKSGESTSVSFRSKYPKALKRAHSGDLNLKSVGDVPVVDPLQLYLDCYSLPDRGREQAKHLLEAFWPDLRVI